jgi:protein involved in sex pheromone biosynthesis
MNKLLAIGIVLVMVLSGCKKYYDCTCTDVTQTITSPSGAIVTTYSITTTTYTIPIDVTKKKSVSQCSAQGGNNGTSDISCDVH